MKIFWWGRKCSGLCRQVGAIYKGDRSTGVDFQWMRNLMSQTDLSTYSNVFEKLKPFSVIIRCDIHWIVHLLFHRSDELASLEVIVHVSEVIIACMFQI